MIARKPKITARAGTINLAISLSSPPFASSRAFLCKKAGISNNKILTKPNKKVVLNTVIIPKIASTKVTIE